MQLFYNSKLLPHFYHSTHQIGQKQTKPRRSLSRASHFVKKAASYSPALHCSTIGAGGLNFSVRNGKRWDPAAITT